MLRCGFESRNQLSECHKMMMMNRKKDKPESYTVSIYLYLS